MYKFSLSLTALCLCISAMSQTAPTTDVWVYSLKEKKGKVSISKGQRITERDGYDNQPTFYQSDFVLYTSQFDGQTDILIHNLYSGEKMNLTNSPESEYSAQMIGNYQNFGAVRVESDGKQRLWLFSMDGKTEPKVVIPQVEPVGYFAWNNLGDVAAFVLGDPVTLIKGNVENVNDKIITSHISRTIKLNPGTNDFSFEKVDDTQKNVIYHLSNNNGDFKAIISKPQNAQDWCVTSNGTYITSIESKLYKYNSKYDSDWVEIADLGKEASKGITRMAVNQDNSRIAIVINY